VNLIDVIETLVDERGLDRDKVIDIVCEGILAAYLKRFPGLPLSVVFNNKTGEAEVFIEKIIVSSVNDSETEITARKAKVFDTAAKKGDIIKVPFTERVGRIEITAAKQVIGSKIRELEQLAVFEEFKDREGSVISGTVHKKERGGVAVKISDVMAFLPKNDSVTIETLRVGHPIRALLKEVLPVSRGGYQLILDRSSAGFVEKLIELEIPEAFEGLVEVKKIVRLPGYKTKAIVSSNSKEIDPVGTCVGVGGARIKPILKELGQEKIDLIGWTENLENLVSESLKPAEIDKVEINDDGTATVWLAQDQRSVAIGKMGQNITLASQLTGVSIQLQEIATMDEEFIITRDDDSIDDDE
jgi:transcription termination/antitermination protein NusA